MYEMNIFQTKNTRLLNFVLNSSIIAFLSGTLLESLYGNCVGPLATIRCKPRQARKGAAAAAYSCAGMWLAQFPPMTTRFVLISSIQPS